MEVFIFILGSCVGSFLNVCIYRIPKKISVITPASFCPKCNNPIRWYDNIPIVSYLFLKGRCRKCAKPISLRYPLVELITGLLFLTLYIKFGFGINFFKFLFFFSLLIVCSFIDIDYRALPVSLLAIGIGGGIIFSFYETVLSLQGGYKVFELSKLAVVKAFYGLIFGFGFTYLFKFLGDTFLSLYLTWKKKDSIEGESESLGAGDVDFMGMVGVFLGAKLVVVTFFLAPFLALGYSVFALLTKRSHIIPYLPYLSGAAFISFIWRDNLLRMLNF